MNSEGGTLLIGVNDDGEVIGIESDIKTIKKQNADGYELIINHLVSNYIGAEFSLYIKIKFETFQGKKVSIVEIEGSNQPIFVKNKDKSFS